MSLSQRSEALEKSRDVGISMSKQQVNDAFTSLLLMTGYLNDKEVITDVHLPPNWKGDVGMVNFKIKEEVAT